ncbi:MAG TPA: hypothetical protein VFV87_22540 [Pirellulaceae bacterium]|nr:hypothetical protein [Pirellulaceae bacterium]
MIDAIVAQREETHVPDAGTDDCRSSIDEVVAVYKKDVDRSMLRENLKLTPTERLERFEMIARQFAEIHEAGRRHRGEV